jgi:glycosyltransferase involved in cell wall biosynthesis
MTDSVPAVTVVIPTHNRAALVGRAIRSVLAQRDVSVDLIVVDDGSRDDTPAVLAAITDPRLTVIRHDAALGVAETRNDGIARAVAPWVAFLDDDDLWAPTKLARQVAAIEGDPFARWACTGAMIVTPELRLLRGERPPDPGPAADHLLRYNHIPGGASGVLAATALVREVGAFDPQLASMADWDLWVRLGLASPLATVDAPLVAYVEHHGMSQQSRTLDAELDVFVRKHAAERSRRGLGFDDAWWERYFGELDARAGRRHEAVTHFLRAARRGDARALAHAALTPFGVGLAWKDRRAARRTPSGWRAETDAWLAAYR